MGLMEPEFPFPMGPGNMPIDFDLARFMSSSSGPINWEVAAYVAAQMAGDADAPARWTDVEAEYAQLVRAAEVLVTDYTGLSAPHLLEPVQVVSRARWAELHYRTFEPMVAPLAEKLTEAQKQAPAGQTPFGNLMGPMMPFMLGAQAGMLAGWLSHHVLGRYDLQVPPPAEGGLVFVAPNLEAAERDLNVVPMDFTFWLAMHEVVRAIEYDQPGIRAAFADLAAGVTSAITIDPDKLGDLSSIQNLDPSDPSSLNSLLADSEGLMEAMVEPGHEEALGRLEAYFGIIEGYAAHVMARVGTERIPTLRQIEDAIEVHRLTADADDMFQQLLGFDVRRHHFQPAKEFCDHVVELEGIGVLNRVWKSAEDRPSIEELNDPDLWLARTVGLRG